MIHTECGEDDATGSSRGPGAPQRAELVTRLGVHDAIVLTRGDSEGVDRRVVYYLGDQVLDLTAVNDQLDDSAPIDALVKVTAMPLDATGAIDRSQLELLPVLVESVLDDARDAARAVAGVEESIALIVDERPAAVRYHVSWLTTEPG